MHLRGLRGFCIGNFRKFVTIIEVKIDLIREILMIAMLFWVFLPIHYSMFQIIVFLKKIKNYIKHTNSLAFMRLLSWNRCFYKTFHPRMCILAQMLPPSLIRPPLCCSSDRSIKRMEIDLENISENTIIGHQSMIEN